MIALCSYHRILFGFNNIVKVIAAQAHAIFESYSFLCTVVVSQLHIRVSPYRTIIQADNNFTPLQLQIHLPENNVNKINLIRAKINNWRPKIVHENCANKINNVNINKEASNLWLTQVNLYSGTECFMIAIQLKIT